MPYLETLMQGDLFRQRRHREAASAVLYVALTCFAAAVAAIIPFLLAPWSIPQ